MGGRIWVESDAGVGSMFAFTASLNGAHILVVEDNEFDQQIIAEVLEQVGVTVALAAPGSMRS
jgi:hypothetical protein